MKIYTLEAKGEVLTILTHQDNISYRRFKEICAEASQQAENDFYTMKDILTSDYGFKLVEACGGFEVSKKRGAF